MSKYQDSLGYIKYEGTPLKDGFLDLKKSAQILTGLDESIRFFVAKQNSDINYEIPVRIQKGSWEVLIPQTIGGGIVTAAGIITTAYLATAATTIAKNDFKDKTTAELIKMALSKIQAVIKITKHVGEKIQSDLKARIYDYNNQIVEIINDGGVSLKISKEEYEAFLECPKNLLNKLVNTVDDDITFKMGVIKSGEIIEEQVTIKEKFLFTSKEDEEEELFPELKDGDFVELTGEITKGNEKTNFIGLEYKGYILSCRPENGRVKQYKQDLFNKAIVSGIVHRVKGESKPQIIITNIINLDIESGGEIRTLF